jgi:hypothetical protein
LEGEIEKTIFNLEMDLKIIPSQPGSTCQTYDLGH